jgi:hypothetical protein
LRSAGADTRLFSASARRRASWIYDMAAGSTMRTPEGVWLRTPMAGTLPLRRWLRARRMGRAKAGAPIPWD